MITVEGFSEWRGRTAIDDIEIERKCIECDGTGECECCGRDCITCGGSGIDDIERLPEDEVRQRYFDEVMESLRRLCAHSTKHDFLDEAGDFIKRHGRMDLPGRSPHRLH